LWGKAIVAHLTRLCSGTGIELYTYNGKEIINYPKIRELLDKESYGGNATIRELRAHWEFTLDPNIDRAELLKEEKNLLVFLYDQDVGPAEVARVVNGLRSDMRAMERPKDVNDEEWQESAALRAALAAKYKDDGVHLEKHHIPNKLKNFYNAQNRKKARSTIARDGQSPLSVSTEELTKARDALKGEKLYQDRVSAAKELVRSAKLSSADPSSVPGYDEAAKIALLKASNACGICAHAYCPVLHGTIVVDGRYYCCKHGCPRLIHSTFQYWAPFLDCAAAIDARNGDSEDEMEEEMDMPLEELSYKALARRWKNVCKDGEMEQVPDILVEYQRRLAEVQLRKSSEVQDPLFLEDLSDMSLDDVDDDEDDMNIYYRFMGW